MAKKSDDKLIRQGDKIIDDSQNDFLRALKASEKFIFEELIKILAVLSVTNGKLQNNAKTTQFILSLDKRINNALKQAGYTSSVNDFLKNFDTLAANAKAIQSEMNGLNIGMNQLKPIINIEKQNTLKKLTSLDKDFIAPLRETIYRNIYHGSDITTIEKTIKDFVLSTPDSDSRLSKYVNQISRDSIQQFDGSIQQTIGDELGLNAIRYVGSIINDSRGQCVKWAQNNGGLILLKDLQEEIDWADAGGSYQGHKISGMIPGTTPETFVILRGGYNCRHRAIYTFVGKK